jgi:hypothetical protein
VKRINPSNCDTATAIVIASNLIDAIDGILSQQLQLVLQLQQLEMLLQTILLNGVAVTTAVKQQLRQLQLVHFP